MDKSSEESGADSRNKLRGLRPFFILLVCLFAALLLFSFVRFIQGKETAGALLSPAGMLLVWSAFIVKEKNGLRLVLLICGGALAIAALVRAIINLS